MSKSSITKTKTKRGLSPKEMKALKAAFNERWDGYLSAWAEALKKEFLKEQQKNKSAIAGKPGRKPKGAV
jgi:hypothetical protein